MKKNITPTQTAREAAYLALLQTHTTGQYLLPFLENWKKTFNPTQNDFNLAQEIAYGTERRFITLEYISKQFTSDHKLKKKEKILLLTALYQFYFMQKLPLYAITNETIEIGKKHCHKYFVNFLNAVLRKLPEVVIKYPKTKTSESLSINHSYPQWFVQDLLTNYQLETTEKILELGNKVGPIMVRLRKEFAHSALNKIGESHAILSDPSALTELVNEPKVYIQNATPSTLVKNLAKSKKDVINALDLCASPGGKSILIHELYPNAELHVNDVSEEKMLKLKQNFAKYTIPANYSISDGTYFKSNEKFDLIILDVPCSNTGVLSKRPEARGRLNEENLQALREIQISLLTNSLELLAPGGQIWYMTCSILKRENELFMEEMAKQFNFKLLAQETILPNEEGWDGGYAACLSLNQ